MSEEGWVGAAEPVKPISCSLGLVAHPLELATGPPDDIGIDPFQGRTQLRLVEVTVVGDPAADARVVHLRQLSQGFVAAVMQRPAANIAPDALQCRRAYGELGAQPRSPICRACSHRSRRGTLAPGSAPDSAGRPPERRDQQPLESPTVASHHSPWEYRPAIPAEESSSLTTAGSRACRGCPKGWPRTPQSTVHPHQPLPGWPSHP